MAIARMGADGVHQISVKCPDCQAAIPEYSKFCYACGAAVPPDPEPVAPEPEDDFSATTRMPMMLPPLDETVPFKPAGEALASNVVAAVPQALDETTPIDLPLLSPQQAPPTVESPPPTHPSEPADPGTTSDWGGSPVPAEPGAWSDPAAEKPSSSGWGLDAARESSKSDWALPRDSSAAKSEWAAPAADRATDSGWKVPAPAGPAKSEWAAPASDRSAGSDWNVPQAGPSGQRDDAVRGSDAGSAAGRGDSWTIRSGGHSASDDSLIDLELRLHRRRRVIHTILFILILVFLAGAAYFVIQGVISMRGTKPAPNKATSQILMEPAHSSARLSPRVSALGPPQAST